MRQSTVLVTVAVVLAVLVAVPAAGLAGTASSDADQPATAELSKAQAANETAPGEQLSGAVSVQGAELEGELDQRAFGIAIGQAASQEAQADVLASQLSDVEQRLDALEERKAKLEAKREAGEISEGKYRAEMAELVAATQTARSLANQSVVVADQLPATVLEQRGIDVTAIQALQDRAGNLTGPEVAAIAREIAGPPQQTPPGNSSIDVPDNPGQGDGPNDGAPGNETDAGQGDDDTGNGDGAGQGETNSDDGRDRQDADTVATVARR